MDFEWDIRKAESNFKKHGVRFSESLPVFEDDYARHHDRRRVGPGRAVVHFDGNRRERARPVVVYNHRGRMIRIISARLAEARERSQYEESR